MKIFWDESYLSGPAKNCNPKNLGIHVLSEGFEDHIF